MLQISQFSIAYPGQSEILRDLNFHIQPGEKVALIGANGAGKTTLLHAICGFLDYSGSISVGSIQLTKKTRDQVRQNLGFVFQIPDDQLFCTTLAEDIAFGLENTGFSPDKIDEEVHHWLTRFNLEKYAQRSAQFLSGGEKRLAALATVLCMNPSLLLLDEPTSFLDRKARTNLENALNPQSQAMLIATHDIGFASRICSRAILICDGRIEADGSPRDLFRNDELMEKCGADALP